MESTKNERVHKIWIRLNRSIALTVIIMFQWNGDLESLFLFQTFVKLIEWLFYEHNWAVDVEKKNALINIF